MTYSINKIHTKRSYTPSEVSELFQVNRRTIFRWFQEGLLLIDPNKTPRLIMGSDLKNFILAKRKKNSCKLSDNEYYCCSCKKGVKALRGSEITKKTGKQIGRLNRDQYMKMALCRYCKNKIIRFI